MPWNLPNTLTWLRICAVPLIVLLFYVQAPWGDPAAGLLFAAAGITDSLDGYFARRLRMARIAGVDLANRIDRIVSRVEAEQPGAGRVAAGGEAADPR